MAASDILDHVAVPGLGDREVLRRTLLDLAAGMTPGSARALLLASADTFVADLAALAPVLQESYVVAYPDPARIAAASHKGRFARLCAAHGVPHPRTVEVVVDGSPALREHARRWPVTA